MLAFGLRGKTSSLSYNVRIGTAPGASDVVAAPALTNGVLLVPQMGSARNGSTNCEYAESTASMTPVKMIIVRKIRFSTLPNSRKSHRIGGGITIVLMAAPRLAGWRLGYEWH